MGIILALCCLFEAGNAYCQDFINARKISLNLGDTTVVAGILADVRIEKVDPGVFYFWYSNDMIYSNQGGYSGNLLHGDYIEYDGNGNLILKGRFDRGLKSGEWVSWYPDGSISEISEYEEGYKCGRQVRYAPDGKISYSAYYKNGLLHGPLVKPVNDTLFRTNYRNGKEKKRIPLEVF